MSNTKKKKQTRKFVLSQEFSVCSLQGKDPSKTYIPFIPFFFFLSPQIHTSWTLPHKIIILNSIVTESVTAYSSM